MPFAEGGGQREAVSCVLGGPCQASPGRTVSVAPPGTKDPGVGARQGVLPWNPGPPMPLLAKGQGPKPDGAAGPGSLEGWLAGSSCCLAQHTASGLNVTSRRSQDGRGSVAEAQVQKGRADLAPLPPPSPPPSWWRVSSGNRGFRKTELLRPPGRREQTASASVTPPPPAPPAVCPHQASRHLDGPGPPRGNRVREGGKGATRSFSTARAGLAPGGEVYVLRLFKGKESSGHLRRRSGAPRWLWAASGTLTVATSLLPACSPHKHLPQVPPQLPEG